MGEIVRKALIILIVLFGVFLAIGCVENEQGTPNETGTPEQAVTEAVTEMQNVTDTPGTKEYTLEELAEYNGENGKVYVAYQDKVYDVSDTAYLWKNGNHKGCIAGTDVTDKIDRTPHGSQILQYYRVVGTLKE